MGAYSMRMARFGLLAAVAVVSMAQAPAEFAVSEIAGRYRSKMGGGYVALLTPCYTSRHSQTANPGRIRCLISAKG
jgi:hypothetical protein